MALGKFQMTEVKSGKWVGTENALANIFRAKPQEASNIVFKLLEYNRSKSLEAELSKFGVKYFDTTDDYTWQLIGSPYRNYELAKCVYAGSDVTSTSSNVGLNGTKFFLYFTEDAFFKGNLIVGENPDVYQIRIIDEPQMEGIYTVYTCEVWGAGSIPASELLSGKKFSAEYSPVSREYSRNVGGITMTSPFAMRGEFTNVRISHKEPGTAVDRKMAVGLPVMKGDKVEVVNTWMQYTDWLLEQQFAKEKNTAIYFGRTNRSSDGTYNNQDTSGRPIKAGGGIREQMEVSNTIFYTKFKLKLIEDALYALCEGKLATADRKFILMTGERGAAQFHKAVQEIATGWNTFNYFRGENQPGIISKAASNLHDNALSIGYQFVEYKAPMGVTLKIEVNPMYDDKVRNKLRHPDGGFIESYRYDIMDIGTMEEPNIQIARVKGQDDLRGYISGPFSNPFTGEKNIRYAATDEDSAIVTKKAVLGAIVFDPSRTMSIIYNGRVS